MKITIASGKGGTGKTTVALNLALSLENAQLMDCDVENPNCHLFLGDKTKLVEHVNLNIPVIDKEKCTNCGKCSDFCHYNALLTLPKDTMFFQEMCHGCGGCTLVCPENAISEKPRSIGQIKQANLLGLNFWTGHLNVGEPMSTPVIRQLKSHISGPITILDSPPGTACPVIETIGDSDFVILVTEPTPFGLHDLKLAVEVVRMMNLPFGVVVNRQGVGDNRVQEWCKDENIRILMEIPQSQDIAKLYSEGKPFVLEMTEWKVRFQELFSTIQEMVA